MSSNHELPINIRQQVVNFCNRDIVPDSLFDPTYEFHSEWFVRYFSFLGNSTLQNHLGDAFHQARFMYKIMCALRLKTHKAKGIIKFQIIQYASIYEAILQYTLDKYYREEVQDRYAEKVYNLVPNAISTLTKINYSGNQLYLCEKAKRKQGIKWLSIDKKADFAVEKGIVSQNIRDRICSLYDLRNNVHILKASASDYVPKLNEAREAFELMKDFVFEVKGFFALHP